MKGEGVSRGVVVGLTALVVAGMLGCGAKPAGSGAPAGVVVRLADADLEVVVRPGALFGSAVVASFANELKKLNLPMLPDLSKQTPAQKVEESIGIAPGDIACVTVSANTTKGIALATVALSRAVGQDVVLAAARKMSGDEIVKVVSHQGVDIYGAKNDADSALAMPDSKVLLVGGVEEIKKGIEEYKSGRTSAPVAVIASALKKAAADACLVVAGAASPQMLGPLAEQLPADAVKDLESVLLTLRATDAFVLNATVTAKTAAGAEQLRALAATSLAMAKQQIAPMTAQAQMKPVQDAVNGITVGGSGTSVEMSARIGSDIVQPVFAALGPMFMGLMGGGMMVPDQVDEVNETDEAYEVHEADEE